MLSDAGISIPSWAAVLSRCSIPTSVVIISWKCFSSFVVSFNLLTSDSLSVAAMAGDKAEAVPDACVTFWVLRGVQQA